MTFDSGAFAEAFAVTLGIFIGIGVSCGIVGVVALVYEMIRAALNTKGGN